jgi:predicted regulator of Ras-like GTPase activity (Roadblock/LC7/MglB family)
METKEAQLNALLVEITKEITGTIGISVVDLSSGMALATYSTRTDFDLNVAAAYNAEVIKQKMKAMAALNLKNETITEMIITLTTQIHFIRFINAKYILYFAVDSSTSNMGMVKTVLSSAVPKLQAVVGSL